MEAWDFRSIGRAAQEELRRRVLPEGSYVTTSGLLPDVRVHLTRGADGVPRMDHETVSRTVGLD